MPSVEAEEEKPEEEPEGRSQEDHRKRWLHHPCTDVLGLPRRRNRRGSRHSPKVGLLWWHQLFSFCKE